MSELLSLPALIARLKAWKSDIATSGSLTATNGLYDGANRAYSDSNPPETLQRTIYPSSSVASSPAGQSTEFTQDGRSLDLKDSSGNVWNIGQTNVRCATTANITLSGTQTIDGISVAVGDLVLVKNQSTPANNGLYVCAAGAWTRVPGFDHAAGVAWSDLICVLSGTVGGGSVWTTTFKSTDTLGTTAMTWYPVIDGGSTQTLAGKTLTSPIIALIKEATNGGTALGTASLAVSPVNYVEVANAATGTPPVVRVGGTDTNVDLVLQGKGTGIVQYNGTEVVNLGNTQTLNFKTLLSATIGASGTVCSGAWTSYTPTLTNVTLGSGGTVNGAYVRIGNTIHFRAGFTLGTSGTLTGAAIITLPVAPLLAPRYPFMGLANDNSATAPFQVVGICVPTSLNITVRASPTTAGASLAATSATIPFAWAVNDTLEITGSYEV